MEKKEIITDNAPQPIGPYSQAIFAGDTLYVSGQIAINPKNGQLIQGDISEETRQVMTNLGAILNEAGLSYENVVKCSIFLKNMNDFVLINAAYEKYFIETAPARETIEVSGLPKNVNVEISCIAVR